jgi:hypothetical protein
MKELLCLVMNLPEYDEGEECSRKESTSLPTEDEFLRVFEKFAVGYVCILKILNLYVFYSAYQSVSHTPVGGL